MKAIKYILPFVLVTVFPNLRAQDMLNVPDSAFFEYAKSLKNKGNDYYMLSNRIGIKQVIDEYEQALERRKAAGNLTEEMEGYLMQDIRKLWGDYHYENSDFDRNSYNEAERYFKQYRDYYQSRTGSYVSGQGIYVAHQELAQLYYKQGHYQDACDEMREVLTSASTYMTDEDEPFDKLSQYAICLARVQKYDEAISNINEVLDCYENIDSEKYGEALRKKAKILMLQEENGGKTIHNEALDCYKEFFRLKKKDALARFLGMSSVEREQYWMRNRPFFTDCYRLEETDAGFLFDVTLFAKGLLLQLDSAGGGKQDIHATWQMIQKKLKPDACAVEFVQYEKYNKQQMGALVLRKTGEPVFVKMASPDTIWNCIVADKTVAERLERTDGNNYNAIDRVYEDSLGLFRMIWNPELLSVIGECKKVYFAPDGYIHRIAIEYMLPKEMETKDLYRLTSIRRLLEEQLLSKSSKALIIGDVDFTKANSYPKGNNDALAYQSMGRVIFPQLKKSKEEVDSIYICRGNSADTLLCGVEAAEQTFRKICNDYPIIHISSHGKFKANGIPFGTDMKPCLTDVSLSESVIALAGVNKALDDESFDAEHSQDGLISAKEISSLDMRDVQLAVLACCETGLGHVTSDGVYGIQRGFKNAGAGAIIMTLWETDDDTTAAFMLAFHRKLCEGKSIGGAFRETREEFLAIDEYNVNRPCYRDVFILIDAIE
jgi:Uncharacterized protein conserved in bacteria